MTTGKAQEVEGSQDPNVGNALQAIDVAIALGGQIKAPVGSIIYSAHVDLVDDDDARNNYGYLVGLYPDKESAEAGMRDWVLNRWEVMERAPWIEDYHGLGDDYYEKEKAFLSENTDAQVIKRYFENSLDSYNIAREQIKPFAKRAE